MREMLRLLHQTLKNGEDAVLVTVVASSGSTPRGAGAHMLITRAGRLRGTIGGGAVEYKSEQMAKEVLKNKISHLEYLRLYRNEIEDLGMICGGDVTVYFQYIPVGDVKTLQLTERMEQLFEEEEQSWLIYEITEGSDGSIGVYGKYCGAVGMEVPQEVLDCLNSRPVLCKADGKEYYLEKLVQAGRVYIFGGGHVAQALVPALAKVNFRCVVLEDREEFTKPELFDGVEATCLIDFSHIEDYVSIGEEDYVCIMTRGHAKDRIVQGQVLKTPARYIGVIGSASKAAGVFAKLREEGFTEEDFVRITTPIGLNILAETPQEIAVSITAQLIMKRAQLSRH